MHHDSTLTAHSISMGNKAKPFRQIWNKHIQTFCLSHLGTTDGFSSYSKLKMYAYLHHFASFAHITVIVPAMKWPCVCTCCPHSSNLPSSAFDDTSDKMWWSLITRDTLAQCWSFDIAHAPHARSTPPSLPPSLAVAAMNNTSFIILLQEICNTWNRMQYAVYFHTRGTQGACVVSVCVTSQDGRKRGEQRKQACVTPDSPSASWGNYSPCWGVGCCN